MDEQEVTDEIGRVLIRINITQRSLETCAQELATQRGILETQLNRMTPHNLIPFPHPQKDQDANV